MDGKLPCATAVVLTGCFSPLLPDDPDTSSENLPPDIDLTASSSLFLGDALTAELSATDPEGDSLSWSFSFDSLPEDSSLSTSDIDVDDTSASFTPDVVGVYVIQVSVTDGTQNVTAAVSVTVTSGAPATGFKLVSPANGATGQETAGLQLDWEDAEGATEYDLYVGAGSLPGSPTATVTDASQYLLTGLSLDTTYVWRVVAKNDGGSTASATFDFTTALPTPAVPANPSPSDGTTDALPGLTLDWANAANATSYDVYLRSPREKSFTRVASEITSSRYTPSDIGYGSWYEWYVVAKNAEHTTTGPTWEFGTQSNNLSYLDAAYWRFNGSLADESGFAHFTDWRPEPAYTHQVPGASPVYTEDRNEEVRSAVALSAGYRQHVIVPLGDLPDSPLANHTIGFSLSLWYREIGTHQNTSLVSRANAKIGYDLFLNSGKGLTFLADGEVVASIPDSAVQRTWNHVVLSWDFDTDQLRIWANGTPVAEEKAAPFTNSTSSVYFGIPHIGSRTSTFFTGALDDIRIYSRPVSETEAEALFKE